MRPNLWRTKTSRSRELGVAAIEFALLMPFIAVIVLALVDYGYYFYIGINATEAARAAAVQASATAAAMNGGTGPLGCTTAADPNIGLVTNAAPAAPAQAAQDYMTAQVNGTIGGNTTATVGCSTAGSGPSAKIVFSVQVQVLFAPPSGTVHFGLPRSGNNLVYTTTPLWRGYLRRPVYWDICQALPPPPAAGCRCVPWEKSPISRRVSDEGSRMVIGPLVLQR